MNLPLSSEILAALDNKEIKSVSLIQKLWKDCGSIKRIKTDSKSYILKEIDFPTGDSTDHLRKKKSFEIERHWYLNSLRDQYFYFPKLYKSIQKENGIVLIMEDLNSLGYSNKKELNSNEIKSVLHWLAYLHAYYMKSENDKYWSNGTYWYLETRQKELAHITNKKLKNFANNFDKKLNSATYKTLVHGDAKIDNFLFFENKAAAVDFQYVGAGVGIKDVMLFFTSIYNETQLFNNCEEDLLFYFSKLKEGLKYYKKDVNTTLLEKEYRELYPIAWADFHRFLDGWKPGHWKINKYMMSMTEKAIECNLIQSN